MKNKIDFKLINILIISLILFIFFVTKDIWMEIISFITKILMPFIISFTIAYFIYPITKFFNKKLNKNLSIIFTVFSVFIFLGLVLFLIGPIIYKESINLIYTLIKTFKNISIKYNINLNNYLDILFDFFFKKPIDIFNFSYNFISNFIIIIILSIYLLIYMEKIRLFLKKILENKKIYNLIKKIDFNVLNYSKTLFYITIITFFEYLIAYLLINHNEALLLSFSTSLLNMIPFFGGIIGGILAILLAAQVGKTLIIKTIIIVVICSFLDSYVINPIMFKKSNNINPLFAIAGIIIFGNLFGILGIILAIPLVIVTKEIIYYIFK